MNDESWSMVHGPLKDSRYRRWVESFCFLLVCVWNLQHEVVVVVVCTTLFVGGFHEPCIMVRYIYIADIHLYIALFVLLNKQKPIHSSIIGPWTKLDMPNEQFRKFIPLTLFCKGLFFMCVCVCVCGSSDDEDVAVRGVGEDARTMVATREDMPSNTAEELVANVAVDDPSRIAVGDESTRDVTNDSERDGDGDGDVSVASAALEVSSSQNMSGADIANHRDEYVGDHERMESRNVSVESVDPHGDGEPSQLPTQMTMETQPR